LLGAPEFRVPFAAISVRSAAKIDRSCRKARAFFTGRARLVLGRSKMAREI
jgi:hypothetical protein